MVTQPFRCPIGFIGLRARTEAQDGTEWHDRRRRLKGGIQT